MGCPWYALPVLTPRRRGMDRDVVLIGGGPIGLSLGIALHSLGFSVALVDKAFPREEGNNQRWFTLSYDVICWLQTLGIAEPESLIWKIFLSCEKKSSEITFLSSDIGHPYLGGMMSSTDLHHKLWDLARDLTLPLFCPSTLMTWRSIPSGWELHLSSGEYLCTPLVVGADGKDSQVRSFFSPSCYRWTFPQKAHLFTFEPMPAFLAYEHFFPGGSLALLPLPQEKGAGISITSGKKEGDIIEERTGTLLGTKIHTLALSTPFDLHVQWVRQKTFHRCVLLGDAAQVMHPIAGQGLNVGLRNANTLASFLWERKGLGLDWGTGLEEVARSWRMPTLAMQAFTTGIVYGLSLHRIPTLWEGGSFVMNHCPRIRRWIMEWASGKKEGER
jgi:2-octaprenyl-3-methyl-6-methoxy-1,4-benzoquinol hydroxylase